MKYTEKDFLDALQEKNPKFLENNEVIGSYRGNKEEIDVRCKKCGTVYQRIPMRMMRANGCPNCSGIKKDNTWFNNKIIELVADEYVSLGTYKTGKTKIMLKHNLCGHEFEMRPEDFINGQRCPKCAVEIRAEKRRTSIESLREQIANAENGGEYILLDKIKEKGTHKKVNLLHTICGTTFEVDPVNFLRGGENYKGTRCPFCFGSVKKTDEEIAEIVSSLDDEYEYIYGTYESVNKHFKIRHKSCGHTYDILMVNFKHGCRCPKCALKSTSEQEKSLLSFVREYFPIADKKRFYKGENKREFVEADICIEEIKTIIEYDGIYWHSTKQQSDKNYHIKKTLFFKELGYRTIHIFEDEWVRKQNLVKRKLRHIFKRDEGSRVFARNCVIKEIDVKTASTFMDLNHIQGKAGSETRIGLFYNDSLVAVMTFGKPRAALGQKDVKDVVELVRYATSENVIGGFSKLLKYAEKTYSYKKIITYADLRWSSFDSNVYDTNGFTLMHRSNPNYFYYNGLEKHHRYQFRKNVLKDLFPDIYRDDLTETQIMDMTKYLRVYDCGNLVFEKTIKKD